jgi:hypothetical protein
MNIILKNHHHNEINGIKLRKIIATVKLTEMIFQKYRVSYF